MVIARTDPPDLEPPLGETVLNATTLEDRGIDSLSDLAGKVPNLVAEPSGVMGVSQPILRGLYSPVGAAPVGLVLDDIPLAIRPSAFVSAADIQRFDIARIEIARGPQVATGGVSAIAGVIRWQSIEPTFDRGTIAASGQVGLIAQGGETYRATLGVGGPVLAETVALRVAALVDADGGYIDRIGPNGSPDVNRRLTYAFRSTAIARPGPGWTIKSSMFFQYDRRRDLPIFQDGPVELRQFFVREQPGTDRTLGAALTVGYAGPVRIDATLSMLQRRGRQAIDYSPVFGELVLGGAIPGLVPDGGSLSVVDTRQDNWAQEVRLSSNVSDDRPGWIAGIRYARSVLRIRQTVSEPGIAALSQTFLGVSVTDVFGVDLLDGQDSFRTSERNVETEAAAFAGLTWSPAASVRLGAEVRVMRSEVTLDVGSIGPYAGTVSPEMSFARSVSTHVLPKVSASVQIAPLQRVGLTISRGFRPGGGNTPVPTTLCATDLAALGQETAPLTFAADQTTNYDLEYRVAAPNAAALRMTAFAIDWTNVPQQITLPGCGFGYVDNIGQARNLGAEIEGTVPVGRHINVSLSAGYVDARLRRGAASMTDRRLPLVPRFSLVAGLTVQRLHFASGRAGAGVTYTYNSSFRRDLTLAQATGTRAGDAPGFGRLDGQLSLAFDQITLTLFGRNLLDARPILYDNVDLVPATQAPARLGTIAPRTLGIRLSYGFAG